MLFLFNWKRQTVTPEQPEVAKTFGGGKSKSRRILATINGQNMSFSSVDELYKLLENIKDRIPQVATKKAKKLRTVEQARESKAPAIEISDVSGYLDEVQRYVAKVNEQISQIYRSALIREAVRTLDEEEAIIALLIQ